jgi:cyclopropane-fatty-acyl-phospholipid synthase
MPLATIASRFVQTGRLTIIDPSGRSHELGPGGAPAAAIRICDWTSWARIGLRPTLALGEAYMHGALIIEQGTLRDLLHLVTWTDETSAPSGLDALALTRWMQRVSRGFISRSRARANARHHYDLSRRLYEVFLDADMQYSCAYFADGVQSLEEAQRAKKRHLAAKLLLQPGHRVLDIGSGWGGLAIDLARWFDAEVTGLTLSLEQLTAARERAAEAGVADRVAFHLRDYRDGTHRYDRIVSVGMFEHVRPRHYGAFFRQIAERLEPNGVAVVHAIGHKEPPRGTNPWIAKYIYPGGHCPALSELLPAIERAGLWVTDIEILRLHYAETLRHWHARFEQARWKVHALYDERFCRMWEFYLVGCEMAFRNGPMMVFQIQLARSRHAVPITRDYISHAENMAFTDGHGLSGRRSPELAASPPERARPAYAK